MSLAARAHTGPRWASQDVIVYLQDGPTWDLYGLHVGLTWDSGLPLARVAIWDLLGQPTSGPCGSQMGGLAGIKHLLSKLFTGIITKEFKRQVEGRSENNVLF